jgi:hypothetical protein
MAPVQHFGMQPLLRAGVSQVVISYRTTTARKIQTKTSSVSQLALRQAWEQHRLRKISIPFVRFLFGLPFSNVVNL